MKTTAKLKYRLTDLFAFLSLLAVALTISSPAFAQAGVQSPRDAAKVFVAATGAGDAERIAALYAPDAIMLAPGLAPISGRGGIKSVFENNFALGRNMIAFSTVRAETGTDRAAVYWEWTSEIATQSGAVHRLNGRSLVYFRKEGGSWLISADMMQVTPAK